MEEEKLTKIDVREMALKCTTKAEIYKVLVNCGRVYLSPVDQINDDFISDILSGDKLVSPLLNLQVCRLKQCQDRWSSTYWRTAHPWFGEVCRKTLSHQKVHAWLPMRQISISKMDM